MKSFTSVLVGTGLLAATSWIPTSESFRSTVSLSSRHKIGNGDGNGNRDAIRRTMVVSNNNNNNNDDMVAAQEAEARKICPLISPPEDVHATFEAAMG